MQRASGLWLLLLDGQALTKQEKEERGGATATEKISQLCFCVGSLFFQWHLRLWHYRLTTRTHHCTTKGRREGLLWWTLLLQKQHFQGLRGAFGVSCRSSYSNLKRGISVYTCWILFIYRCRKVLGLFQSGTAVIVFEKDQREAPLGHMNGHFQSKYYLIYWLHHYHLSTFNSLDKPRVSLN